MAQKFSIDLTTDEVLRAVANLLHQKYGIDFDSGSIRPCYDAGFGGGKLTGFNFTGTAIDKSKSNPPEG